DVTVDQAKGMEHGKVTRRVDPKNDAGTVRKLGVRPATESGAIKEAVTALDKPVRRVAILPKETVHDPVIGRRRNLRGAVSGRRKERSGGKGRKSKRTEESDQRGCFHM